MALTWVTVLAGTGRELLMAAYTNTKEWRHLRKEMLERDGYACLKCGYTEEDGATLEVHHIRPHNRGGAAIPENLVTLCTACHMEWKAVGQMLHGRNYNSFLIWMTVPMRASTLVSVAAGAVEMEEMRKQAWHYIGVRDTDENYRRLYRWFEIWETYDGRYFDGDDYVVVF